MEKKKKSKNLAFVKRISILIILLILAISYLHLNKSLSYSKYERIRFESSGSILYANLYYPAYNINFQQGKPLLIYCHGVGSQRDFDLRIPIEFTKRGFYVVSLDYQGHGESGGSIGKIAQDGVPALAKDCSILLDTLETMPFYANVNTSQIGLIGHSMGGMVVLMNQALDPRINITVGWAPLVNFEPEVLGLPSEFEDYIPGNLMNDTNTNNLLIIMHENDEILNFTEQALVAQNLTGCEVIKITEPLIGGGHQLFTNRVIIESINWFENYFFNSETINGPITITFMLNYIVILITWGLLFLLIYSIISFSAKFFFEKQEKEEKEEELIVEEKNKELKRSFKNFFQILKIVVYVGIFLVNWIIFESIFGLLGLFYASLNILILFIVVEFLIYLRNYKKEEGKIKLGKFLKSKVSLRLIIFLMIYSISFIVIYLLFSQILPESYYLYLLPITITLIIMSTFTVASAVLWFSSYLKRSGSKEIKSDLTGFIKHKFPFKPLGYSLLSSLFFIGVYLIVSFSYPFAFMWPSSFNNFIVGSLTIFPVYFSLELLYRKAVYPCLNFIKSEGIKTVIIIALAIVVQFVFILLTSTWSFLPSVVFTQLILLLVVIQNTIIFQHTKSFGAVILSSFLIIQLFFSAVISNALGIGATLHFIVAINP